MLRKKKKWSHIKYKKLSWDPYWKTWSFFLLWKKKVLPFVSFSLWVFFTTHISDTSGHQMHGDFIPHQEIICDSSWASYNLTQFWHSVSRDNIRVNILKGSVPQNCFYLLQVPISNTRVPAYPQLLSSLPTNEGSPWPSSQFCLVC